MDKEITKKKTYKEEDLRRIWLELQSMSLSDNELFLALMRDPKLFSHVLSVVIGEKMSVMGEIKMVFTNHEIRFSSLNYHTVYLDAYAADSKGNIYHIEMENVPSKMPVKRVRYYCAASDVASLKPGDGYDKIPLSIHLIFTKGDLLGNKKAVTMVTRKTDEGKEYGDESYIYHINMLALAEGALGMLIRSMLEPNPEKIEDTVIKGVLKSAKGDDSTVRSIHDIKDVLSKQEREAFFNAGKAEGMAEGKAEERKRLILNALEKGISRNDISSFFNISIDEIDDVANKSING
ncbi:MAG: hypothetical protein J6R23_01555 [Spirochaetales bacterium]|nr:hypothetical protein [Spirochaetales bacterium]